MKPASRRSLFAILFAAGFAAASMTGCSDDPSEPSEESPVTHRVDVRFGRPPLLLGWEARVVRLNPRAIPADSAVVTVDRAPLLLVLGGDADTAFFRTGNLLYGAGPCSVSVSLGAALDSCTFVRSAVPRIQIESPENEDEFIPGQPIEFQWRYFGGAPDSVYLMIETEESRDWIALSASNTSYTVPGAMTRDWEDMELYISMASGLRVGSFSAPWIAAGSGVSVRGWGFLDEFLLYPGAPLPPGIPLHEILSAAGPGEFQGHAFTHYAELDSQTVYVGGAVVREDTCIRARGAKIDLAGESIVVEPRLTGHTRLDIDHALIVNGYLSSASIYGGALEYREGTCGWLVNNTFYANHPNALYMNHLHTAGDATKVVNNIFFRNGWGLVRNDEQETLYVRHNDSFGNMMGNYGEHTGCTSCSPLPISPDGEELHISNKIEDPLFVQNPEPPKRLGDFHLRPESRCIGTGEDPVTGQAGATDKGAFLHSD